MNASFPLADSTSNSIVKVPADFIKRTEGKATHTVQVPRYCLVPQTHKKLYPDVLSRMGVKVDTLRRPLNVEVGVRAIAVQQRRSDHGRQYDGPGAAWIPGR